jgi:iron complex outermembrane receptor protein
MAMRAISQPRTRTAGAFCRTNGACHVAAVVIVVWASTARGQSITLPEVEIINSSPRRTNVIARTPKPATRPPAIEAIGSAPLSVDDIERDKVPSNTQVLRSDDFDHARSWSVPEALLLQIPGVLTNDVSGNPFQPDVQYRGFVASPVLGTPQGLAIYQNGVRVNEAFGDTVNWDFIPEAAVNRMTLVPGSAIYGLNALGGAMTLEMKNGFTYHGTQAEISGGSFGRRAGSVQAGGQNGNVAGYIAADALNDDGWRDRSPSRLRRVYADVSTHIDGWEAGINFSGASNFFGAAATTPIQMLSNRWGAVYTTPQTTHQDLAFVNANASYQLTDTLALKGLVYFRGFRQQHVDGNTSDVLVCNRRRFPGFLCFDDDLLFDINGNRVPNILGGATPGSIDRTGTYAQTFGGSLQANNVSKVGGRDNSLVIGASIDHGNVNFSANSELGVINPDLFVTGTGVIISQPSGDVAPVQLHTTNTYTGIYATDTLDLTPLWSVTAGGRFNVAQIRLDDQLGTALNGSHEFTRFNPVIGTTYKITPTMTAYAGYSEANRAPTPSELGCADPARPCLLDNFVTSDPALKQVVSHTLEAGLRGNVTMRGDSGRIVWNLGAFHTENNDDILTIPSQITGRGFFQNVGRTLRQGVEAAVTYTSNRWNVSASYTFLDAMFLDAITLSSPNNPLADADGLIAVRPGDRLPTIPQHRFKFGAEYKVTPELKAGVNLVAASSQFLVGDESNQNPVLPGYWTVNLNTTYSISRSVDVFGLVQNVFNRHYYTFGTFFDRTEVPFLGLTDPRSVGPAAPLAAYAGLRAKW